MDGRPPTLIECRRLNSSAFSSIGQSEWSSFRLLNQMIASKSRDDGDGASAPADGTLKKRNRTNVILWSERDVKMFYLRIAAEVLDDDDDDDRCDDTSGDCDTATIEPVPSSSSSSSSSDRRRPRLPPARLPPCFTEEERVAIENSLVRNRRGAHSRASESSTRAKTKSLFNLSQQQHPPRLSEKPRTEKKKLLDRLLESIKFRTQ